MDIFARFKVEAGISALWANSVTDTFNNPNPRHPLLQLTANFKSLASTNSVRRPALFRRQRKPVKPSFAECRTHERWFVISKQLVVAKISVAEKAQNL
ncbi:hypothetical protein NKH47_15345 [Mesorhizobium sp. M1060]|uniref:hypothetical protein n=1 Tax=unclassified Mesorhizobium TaxID=325217 RepID=UPI0012EB574C|nr:MULTISPECIES: hypothetical protein [unclassified Mesorhizobium]WJI52793.1 hypothetical protein NLY44_09085 [Mesorhizobium sp. C089B]